MNNEQRPRRTGWPGRVAMNMECGNNGTDLTPWLPKRALSTICSQYRIKINIIVKDLHFSLGSFCLNQTFSYLKY